MKVKIKLKPITIDLLELLRKWRNEKRMSFISQAIITRQTHLKWFKKYQQKTNETIYIVFYQDKPVGSLSTIKDKKGIEIGRVVLGDQSFSRKGIMGSALEEVIKMHKGLKFFLEVRKDNVAAVSFYKKHGFTVTDSSEICYSKSAKTSSVSSRMKALSNIARSAFKAEQKYLGRKPGDFYIMERQT